MSKGKAFSTDRIPEGCVHHYGTLFSVRIPEGCVHHYGALFSVPFNVIRTSDEGEGGGGDDYKFKNPRMLTEKGQAELLDKKLSADLRESIKTRTLLNPLVCRWVEEGGRFYPLVVGGDRRYRALDFLIRKKEIVTDPRHPTLDEKGQWVYKQVPANEAYEKVLCQIFVCNTDLDALALAWAENKGRINLTEGHEVAEVIKLRKHGASDERIMEILQQDEKWLRDTDALINNFDSNTLADLLEGRIDRKGALELATVEDVALRGKIRQKANLASQETYEKKYRRYQREVEAALHRKDIAEGEVADAVYQEEHGEADEATVMQAQDKLQEADRTVKRAMKERDTAAPVTTAKDVKQAKQEVLGNGEAGGTATTDKDKPPRMLRAAQIKKGLVYIEAVIKNGGKCPDGTFLGGASVVESMKLLRKILTKNILNNDSDFQTVIRRHVKKQDEDAPK
jgi:hypothetical protein